MRIFLSWSGSRSKALARALREWLPDVESRFNPWISCEDIEKGARWLIDIGVELERSEAGIVCLTRENLKSEWILFEAGALAKALDRSRVCTYLLGIGPSELTGPLVQFQATRASKEDTLELLKTLNAHLGNEGKTESQLDRAFRVWWPRLDSEIKRLGKEATDGPIERSELEILEEVLDLLRGQLRSPVFEKHPSFRAEDRAAAMDFLRLFDDTQVRLFADAIGNPARDDDPNAEQWANRSFLPTAGAELDGTWSSRWYEDPYSSSWQTGVAKVITQGELVVILHRDPEKRYFMLSKRWPSNRLVGRHFNLKKTGDSYPWVGTIVTPDRIDGFWPRGRWDLRRSDRNET